MIVYGAAPSPFVRKVLAFAAEKSISIEMKPISLGSTDPEFLAASPFRKMPALRDGDFTLCDSSAIVTYLEALHGAPALIPAEPRARARAIWFDEFGDTILMPVAGRMFFNRFVAPRILGRPGDEATATKAETEELPPILNYLEGQIPDSLHLVEDRLTLADIAVVSPLVNLAHLGFEPGRDRWPKVAAFARTMMGRPSFALLIAAERRLMSR